MEVKRGRGWYQEDVFDIVERHECFFPKLEVQLLSDS